MRKDNWTFNEISSSHVTFMRLIALISFDNKTFDHWWTKVIGIYIHVMNFIYNGMWIGYGIRMLMRLEFEVEFLCELMIVESICIRYLILYVNRLKLANLIDRCQELWSNLILDEDRLMRNFERKAFWFRNLLIASSIMISTSFIISAMYVHVPHLHSNITEKKTLPFRFFMDVYEEPWFTLVSILQDLVAYTMAFENAAIETIGLYLIMMACGYLRLVRNRLLNLRETSSTDDEELKLIYEDVINCTKFHQKIMLFCEELEQITRKIFLITVFTTVYNMSITGIKLLQNDPDSFKFVSIFLTNFLQFFVIQWCSEQLLIESGAISNAAYVAAFKRSSYRAKTSKTLMMMMLRAQKPIQLTAGGYINLSIETFGRMIRNAFSFFAVLRNFRN